MTFTDKSLTCSDCSASFTFSAQDQEFFAQKGYTNEPKRCSPCREAKKTQRGGFGGGNSYNSGYSNSRQMYPATCAQCGKTTQVPFEPRTGKPVYCSDCYRNVKR